MSDQPKFGKKYVMVLKYAHFYVFKAIWCEKSIGEIGFSLSLLAAEIWATEKRRISRDAGLSKVCSS